MDECTLCGGRWWKRPGGAPAEGEAFVEGHDVACPACCSIVATHEIRVAMVEWLGFDIWHARPMLPWWRSSGPRTGTAVIPLYLRGGFDFGARLLASRLGADVEASCVFACGVEGAWLKEAPIDDGLGRTWFFLPDSLRRTEKVIPVHLISQIPLDLPSRIRAAAAMRLAWDATEVTS